MSMNLSSVNGQPKFVKEMKGAGEQYGIKQSYANVNDVANLRQTGKNYWEADSASNQKNPNGTNVCYHFDNNGAAQILNYLA